LFCFFYQDFLYSNVRQDSTFFNDLSYFVKQAGSQKWFDKLSEFKLDLSMLDKNVHLCMTIPKAKRSNQRLFGMERLKQITKSDSSDYTNCPVIIQAFSLGGASSNRQWMEAFSNSLNAKLSDLKIVTDGGSHFFDSMMTLRRQNMLFHVATKDMINFTIRK
jgi:hypothetical protein